MSPNPSYSIADVQALLSQRVGLDLSPIELAEVLWLALQQGVVVPEELEERQLPSPSPPEPEPELEPALLPPSPANTSSSQPESIPVVADPPRTRMPETQEDLEQTAGPPLPVNVPETVALRNRQAIGRSLRPLMRKVASKQRRVFDEEATITQVAETQIWSPVVKPEPERWLELAIVIEVTNLLDVWQDTITEFQRLMERHGAFRNVRTWQLKPNAEGEPELFLQTSSGLRGSPRSPRELLDASGRRQILLLSDCTSRAWRSGRIPKLLELWSRENPVAIVQLLPEHYWSRSALKASYPVALRSRRPGALSRDWAIEGLSTYRRKQLPEGLKLPVVTMQPESLGRWAQAIAATHDQQTIGVLLNPQGFQAPPSARSSSLTAKQLVQRFRNTASLKAQELADMMAVLPVNWSVIRLIQKNLIQDEPSQQTGALYLAEVFLSGLMQTVSTASEESPKYKKTPQYDFVEGVRDVLLGTIPKSEAQAVGEEITAAVFKQLPADVQERVNADIERRYGDALSYFEAFLIPDLPWGDAAAADIFPFAQVTRQVLQRWGGPYAELAEQLGKRDRSSINETAAYAALEEHLDYFQREILDDFIQQERQFELHFPGLRHKEVLAQPAAEEITLAEGHDISVLIISRPLTEITEDSATFELAVRISFSVEISYLDHDQYVPDLDLSPTYEEIVPDQGVDGVAVVTLSFFKDAIEPELVELRVNQPILIDPTRTRVSSSHVLALQELEFEVVTVAYENDSSIGEFNEVHAAAIAWFAKQNIEVRASSTDNTIVRQLDYLASSLVENYDLAVLAPLFLELRKATLRKNHSFSCSLSSAPETTTSQCVDLGNNMLNEELLAEFTYNRATHVITGTLSNQSDVIKFFSDGWLDRYICQKALQLIREEGLRYSYLVQPIVCLPNGDRFHLDLFFLIDDRPFLVESKISANRKIAKEAINQAMRMGDRLGIPPEQTFLVAFGSTPMPPASYGQSQSLAITNENTFLADFKAALFPASLAFPLEPFEFEVATINPEFLGEIANERLIELISNEFLKRSGQPLSPIQRNVISTAINRVSYESIAEIDRAPGLKTIRAIATHLWEEMTALIGTKVTKSNFRTLAFEWIAQNFIQRTQGRGQHFIENLGDGVTLDMVQIPGGEFLMGSPEDELDRFEDESPQHPVSVPSFLMGRYPITQEQWRAIARRPQVNRELDPEPSGFKGDFHPVERVSWLEAVEFCDRLTQLTGRTYRLPTEAEWEYACRAGTTTPFHFGATITADLANNNAGVTYGSGPRGEYRETTTPVDHFGVANAFGLSEMHGNVFEWCQDHWHNNYEGAPTDGSARVEEEEGDRRRVLRGGSWYNSPRNCRSASRLNYSSDDRFDNVGFRVVCVSPRILQ